MPASAAGAQADVVHLDVVGMAVAAALVVDGEDLGVLLAQDRGELRAAASSTSAPENAPSASFVGSSAMPESW